MSGRSDPRFDDGAHVRSDFRERDRSPAPRKTAQLCAQIQRALEIALVGECDDEALQDLTVASVDPAPDSRRLRVRLVVPQDWAELGREVIEQRLEAERDTLVEAVIGTIHRRRAPELVFELVRDGG